MQAYLPLRLEPIKCASPIGSSQLSSARAKPWCSAIKPPSWRETDAHKRRQFFDEIRSILIEQGDPAAEVNRQAQIVTDALSGIGLLDQLLRAPFVEEIFVRIGEVAVEYDGAFCHMVVLILLWEQPACIPYSYPILNYSR